MNSNFSLSLPRVSLPKITDFFVLSNNFVKNVIIEIKRECKRNKTSVNEILLKFIINLLSFNPLYGLNDLSKIETDYTRLDRERIENIVKFCTNLLSTGSHSAFLKTIQLQIFFLEHAIDKQKITEIHKNLLQQKTEVLTKEISECRINTVKERENLFKNIAVDIIIKNSLGDPANSQVLEETCDALKSVMSNKALSSFISLRRTNRLEMLISLSSIVCGIRVFNKDANVSGEGIVDLKEIILKGYSTTKSQLSVSLNEIHKRIDSLTNAIQKYFKINGDKIVEEKTNLLSEEFEEIDELIDVLIMYHQNELYTKNLIELLTDTKLYLDKKIKLFRSQLDNIHESVKYRTAIISDKIFPKFSYLSKIWMQLQGIVYILSEINIINEHLMYIIDELIMKWQPIVHSIINNCENKRKVNVSLEEQMISRDNNEVEVLNYSTNLNIEFNSFCAWSIANRTGFLIPANLNLGIFNYRGKNYAFNSTNGANHFINNPQKTIQAIFNVLQEKPQLIIFFNSLLDIKEFQKTEKNQIEIINKDLQIALISKSHIDTQTELHPIPYNFDKNYESNIWGFRRRAIQMANIRKCQTHLVQTMESYGKYNIGIQHNRTKNKSNYVQTHYDGYTNVPKPQTYLLNKPKICDNSDDSHKTMNEYHQFNLTLPIDKCFDSSCTNIEYNLPLKDYTT